MNPLNEYRSNVYSQAGEDGILQELLRRLDFSATTDLWCVEFGAWDGLHFSNTCNLIRSHGFKAVLIEADPKKARELELNFPSTDIIKLCTFVSFDGNNTLDNILAKTPIPQEFAFLSIDIDGADYWILESLHCYRPAIICIEFNPTIPNSVEYIQPRTFKVKHGSSALSIVKLAESKDYSLVATTEVNLIFVCNERLQLAGDLISSLESLHSQGNNPTYVFVGQDGTILSNKDTLNLGWHNLSIPFTKLQVLPRLIRKFPGDYSVLQARFLLLFSIRYDAKRIFDLLWTKFRS